MSKLMISKIVALFCILLFPLNAYSDVDSKVDKTAVNIHKGDKAPYDGVLLTYKFAADVMENCKPEIIDARCKAKTDEAVKLCKNECKEQLFVASESLSACQKKYNDVNVSHQEEVEKLKKRIEQLTPSWYESPKLWFGVGIFVGGAVVVAVARNVN